jgi:hypothetical protein
MKKSKPTNLRTTKDHAEHPTINFAVVEETSRRLGVSELLLIKAVLRRQITIGVADDYLPLKHSTIILQLGENCRV